MHPLMWFAQLMSSGRWFKCIVVITKLFTITKGVYLFFRSTWSRRRFYSTNIKKKEVRYNAGNYTSIILT